MALINVLFGFLLGLLPIALAPMPKVALPPMPEPEVVVLYEEPWLDCQEDEVWTWVEGGGYPEGPYGCVHIEQVAAR